MKKIATIALALLLLCSLSACVNQIPLSDKALKENPMATPTPTTIPLSTVKAVAEPWVIGGFQKGIQLYWHTNHDSSAIVKAKADRILDYVVGLDANAVAISFPIYVDGPKPTHVYAGDGTPSVTELQIVIHEAHLRKLRITLRPIVDEANITAVNPSSWRGAIVPVDASAWFASYQQVITPYVQLAALDNVAEFVLGTEFNSLQDDTDQWNALSSTFESTFTESNNSSLSYADNWDRFQAHSYGPLANLGVDAYPQFAKLSSSATVDQLTAAWVGWINTSQAPGYHVSLQEVGIPAQAGAYKNPGNWGHGKAAINQAVQANWFAAACNAAKQTGVVGIYFWNIDINTDPAAANSATDPSTSFIGRAGQDSIRECFTS